MPDKPLETAKSKKPVPVSRVGSDSADREMGAALRSIYQRTIEEDIPSEMLSLLGKLD